MFISEFSGKQIDEGVTPIKFVTYKRERIYTHERKRRERDDDRRDDRRERDFSYGATPPASKGWEIVQELSIAPSELEAAQAKYGEGIWLAAGALPPPRPTFKK